MSGAVRRFSPQTLKKPPTARGFPMVGAGRIELPTSSASRKRSPTELSARYVEECTSEATPGIEPG